MSQHSKEYDCFLSFANEDKPYARKLYQALGDAGVKVWFSGEELKLGDSIATQVNIGLSNSHYGIVLLSNYYLNKEWPRAELNALFAQYTAEDRVVILPLWHEVDYDLVREVVPLIADKFALKTSEGLEEIVYQVQRVLKG